METEAAPSFFLTVCDVAARDVLRLSLPPPCLVALLAAVPEEGLVQDLGGLQDDHVEKYFQEGPRASGQDAPTCCCPPVRVVEGRD
jgi:hypothetical protein